MIQSLILTTTNNWLLRKCLTTTIEVSGNNQNTFKINVRTILNVDVSRDWSELNQATMFLHDNGVLLHYDDSTLRELYFLDPQWLCDMLAHVVTVREINPFARTGIMKLADLQHVFKSSCLGAANNRGYIVSLLNKFEVALTWDARTLLIPSLLPAEEHTSLENAVKIRVSFWILILKYVLKIKLLIHRLPLEQRDGILDQNDLWLLRRVQKQQNMTPKLLPNRQWITLLLYQGQKLQFHDFY